MKRVNPETIRKCLEWIKAHSEYPHNADVTARLCKVYDAYLKLQSSIERYDKLKKETNETSPKQDERVTDYWSSYFASELSSKIKRYAKMSQGNSETSFDESVGASGYSLP